MFSRNSIGQWLGIFLLALAALSAPAQSKEYQIKAAFLFNFVQFVEWPPASFANTNAPLCIGVLGENPFGAALDEIVQGEAIGNHKLTVQRSRQVDDLKNCQMIFIGKSEKSRLADILSALDSRPVLTVSEIDGFDQHGGIINFYLEGTKVRFEINPSAAQRDGLRISSELLNLGKIVETEKEGK